MVTRSLHRDVKHAVEKEQAIKLIRTIIEVGTVRRDSPTTGDTGTVPLTVPVMRTIIAVAEHADDPFRPICIQTLVEVRTCSFPSKWLTQTDPHPVLIDIDLLSRTGGVRFLLHVLGEGPIELATLLASAFLQIVDSPRTRAYLHVGVDLEVGRFCNPHSNSTDPTLVGALCHHRCIWEGS